MENDHRDLTTNTVGFCLLPSELIQYIFLNLALPDIFLLKSVNKSIFSTISDRDFVRDYNLKSSSATWLFIYRKRWHRDGTLHGFSRGCNRWYKIQVSDMLKKVVPPGEDVYFLAAAGNFFLFALNTSQEIVAVNHLTRTTKRVPPSPLGPRGTSSWRRSGMKLLSCPPESNEFRFLFTELSNNHPVLYEYSSKTNLWRSLEAQENVENVAHDYIFLNAYNGQSGSVVVATWPCHDEVPIVLRPRLAQGGTEEGQVGTMDCKRIYGDGKMMMIKSSWVHGKNKRVRVLNAIELWGLDSRQQGWEFITRAPDELVEKVKKPYGAMMGCLEQREGMIRSILMSNLEGDWDMIWLCYDIERNHWSRIPLPECKMKGSNMAGIALSFGLSLS